MDDIMKAVRKTEIKNKSSETILETRKVEAETLRLLVVSLSFVRSIVEPACVAGLVILICSPIAYLINTARLWQFETKVAI
jgi:hypothetical protein